MQERKGAEKREGEREVCEGAREQGKLSPGAQIPHRSHRHGGTRERTQHTDTHKAHARSQTGVQSPPRSGDQPYSDITCIHKTPTRVREGRGQTSDLVYDLAYQVA